MLASCPDVLELEVIGDDDEVCIALWSQDALFRMDMECLGYVGAENLDSLVDGNAFLFDHVAEFREHGMLIADADANRIASIVKHWHAAIAVGTHGDVGKRNTGIQG